MSYSTTLHTPPGPLSFVADDDDAIVAAGWTEDVGELLSVVTWTSDPPVQRTGGSPAANAVEAYCDGDLEAPAAIRTRPPTLGPFVTHAWSALRTIAPGDVVSYRELATRAGRPNAIRAAASACARNPSALFVPCHRVRRTDGALGGFRWGTDIKRWLLDHERTTVTVG